MCVWGGRPAKVSKTAARMLLMSALSSLPELQVCGPVGGLCVGGGGQIHEGSSMCVWISRP
jgi:hypothetical protein